ncbi:MAG: oxaloacetate decarboxylase [Ruminococcaceae bacterium]|nr:oxaloacetate decarboxylase [Oscillospiraceae bacterium]
MNFKPEMFIETLPNLGIGMLVIIAVMGVIIGITTLLNKFTSGK